MKYCYALILLLFGLAVTLRGGDLYRGYLVTKNGKQLTGYLGNIQHNGGESRVVFVNDFGTPYKIHPALIRGFVFRKDERWIAFESKRNRRNWMFLRVVYKGDRVSLYKAPEERQGLVVGSNGVALQTYTTHEYYIELNDRQPYRLRRWGFRRRMRRLLNKRAPELAEKIGQKGYRFDNLEKIVKEFNETLQPMIFKL